MKDHDSSRPKGTRHSGSRAGKGRERPVPARARAYFLGFRCKMTTTSVPEPGPLLVPDGWPVSYGFCSVGQPTKCCELYSNHCDDVVVGMIGRLSATKVSIGTKSAVCSATVAAPASLASAASMAGFLSRSKSPVAAEPLASALSSQPSYMLNGVSPPFDQCMVSSKSPEATSESQVVTACPWNVASMPAARSSCATMASSSA